MTALRGYILTQFGGDTMTEDKKREEKLPPGICQKCSGGGFAYPADAGLPCPACKGTGASPDPIRAAAEEIFEEVLGFKPDEPRYEDVVIRIIPIIRTLMDREQKEKKYGALCPMCQKNYAVVCRECLGKKNCIW
jgi:hypothetical protein